MIFAAHFIFYLFLFQFVSVENISYIKHSYLNSLGGGFSEHGELIKQRKLLLIIVNQIGYLLAM